MFDPNALTNGVVTSVASSKTLEAIDGQHQKNVENLLQNLIDLVQEARDYFALNLNPVEEKDIYKVVTLYKVGQGSLFNANEVREYVYVLTAVDTPVSVNSTPLGTFVYTVKAGVWTAFNFPDGSLFSLDNSATNPTQNFWVRYTNQNL